MVDDGQSQQYFHNMIISLENFDEHGRSRPILNSPRSIEACKRQGIDPSQLIIKTMEEIKRAYKDGMNDKKSLQIKMQHYESRRKNKLEVVRKERSDIINNLRPVYRPNHSTRRDRVQIIEVEDKLEKKRIMDEVKAELKQKQLYIKEMKIANKINKLEQQKKQEKLRKEMDKIEHEKRAEHNQIRNQILHETKINNYLFTQMEKQQKIQQALNSKKNLVEQLKKQKEQYYDKKSKYVKELQAKTLQQKRQKVDLKFTDLDQRLQQKEERQQVYRRNLQEQKRKDALWKQTKLKQSQIQQKKRQNELIDAMMHKQIKKQEYIGQIEIKKQKYYGTKKQDRQEKSKLIKNKMLEDEREIQKRRRIMELIEEQQRRQEQQRKLNERAEMQGRRQQLIQRQKSMNERLKQEQKMKEVNNQYILQKNKQKLNQVDERRKQIMEKQKEKGIIKELKQKQAEQNRVRLEKIKQYEKTEQIAKYNDKMTQLEQQKKVQRVVKIAKSIDRSSVQSKMISDHSFDRNKTKQNRENSQQKIKSIKMQAKRNPIQAKQILKKEEINKLIQNLKIQCNKEEYVMMKEEQKVEKQRQELEKTAESVAQLRRLQKIHGVERARFQEKLTAVMKANLEKVERYRTQLLK